MKRRWIVPDQSDRRAALKSMVATVSSDWTFLTDPAERLHPLTVEAEKARQGRGDLTLAEQLLDEAGEILQSFRSGPGVSAAVADRSLGVLHQQLQIALDRCQPKRFDRLFAQAKPLLEPLTGRCKLGWQCRLAHAEGRKWHNRGEFTQALRCYQAVNITTPTLQRDIGSALRAVGNLSLARRHLATAARMWGEVNNLHQQARCESLLCRAIIDEGREMHRTDLVERGVTQLRELEARVKTLAPHGNPLAFVQHRINLLAGLTHDVSAARDIAWESLQLIGKHGYLREGQRLRSSCAELGLDIRPLLAKEQLVVT